MDLRGKPRTLLGLAILILGVVWLLNNFGMTNYDMGDVVVILWYVFLVLWGLDMVLRSFVRSNIGESNERLDFIWNSGIIGLFLVIIGASLLARKFGLIEVDVLSYIWKLFWPFILITIGLSFLQGGHVRGGTHWAVMSGIEQATSGWKLASGSYIAFMGGVTLDLRKADIPEGETVLDLTAVMGGIDIKVPSDINIVCEGTAILGGLTLLKDEGGGLIVSRRTEQVGAEDTNRSLRIYCRVLMGGVDIKTDKLPQG